MNIDGDRTFRPRKTCAAIVAAWFAVLAIALPVHAAAQESAPVSAVDRNSNDARLRAIGLRLTTANAAHCQAAQTAAALPAAADAMPPRPVRGRCSGRFIVSSASQINAWADGRDIGVTAKMMRFAGEDDTLAFVVAHELAHNILAHAERLRGISSQFVSVADAQRIRETEIEADTLAIELMTNAGFDPQAAQRLLSKLAKQGRAQMPPTYPSFAERIDLVKTLSGNADQPHIHE